MYIEAVPHRSRPPAILLRESYREGGKVRKRTLCNLSDWPAAHIEGLRGVLKVCNSDGAITEQATIEMFERFRADVGISSIDNDGGLFDYDLEEVLCARTIIRSSRRVFL